VTSIGELFGARTALVVDGVVTAERAAEARARLAFAGYQPYRLYDRGSYHVVGDPPLSYLVADVAHLASARTGRALAPIAARALRLGPGDYLLGRHDVVHDDHPIELVVDLSPAAVPGAAVEYRRRGQVFFVAPSRPGAVAIVERGPTVTANHTYVSRLHADAEVVRLVVLLRDAPVGRDRGRRGADHSSSAAGAGRG
jgi:hypothetical protein